ncbi:MAG: aromatic amino acid ammonia-lyase [Methylobacillus sp.]|jgi:histidine ammonia-lyase|nr:aromatic amino acid ammonia-lyase [Methylobacillus sp.]
MTHTDPPARTFTFDTSKVHIEDVIAIAMRRVNVQLSDSSAFRETVTSGAEFIDQLLEKNGEIYGVTTGYGDSCTVSISAELSAQLPHRLYTFHGCGLGAMLTPEQTRAAMVARLTSLCKGWSGVSVGLLEQLTRFLQLDILPMIPSEGSVGASGDLTPLSYLAAALCGEREVWRDGNAIDAAVALAEAGITPLKLRPKEGLAIMNGTAVMTGLACLAWARAAYVMQLATRITAMASVALDGNAAHFDATLFSVKPHVGQQQIAAWLRSDLGAAVAREGKRLQDRYSIRCAPHVIGVLADAMPWFKNWIENELNSVNDNPVIDAKHGQVLHGGHFYGGHIAFVMDSMKTAIANIADLLDRQMALLVDTRYNHGLPANLSGATDAEASINHGLKALQISVSAWAAEALKLTMPASVFSRSTECHNQDKVSMGTIAARDCLRVLDLTEQVVAALLIAVMQGVGLRQTQSDGVSLTPALENMLASLKEQIGMISEDRRLDQDLHKLLAKIRAEAWALYE